MEEGLQRHHFFVRKKSRKEWLPPTLRFPDSIGEGRGSSRFPSPAPWPHHPRLQVDPQCTKGTTVRLDLWTHATGAVTAHDLHLAEPAVPWDGRTTPHS